MDGIVFGIILLVLLISVVLICLTSAESGVGTVLGVAIPSEELQSIEVRTIVSGFRKSIYLWSLLFAGLAIPIFGVQKWVFLQFPILLIWNLLHLWVCWRCQETYSEKMRKLRKEKGWPLPNPQQVTIDLSVSRMRKNMAVSPLYMLPGVLLSLIPLLFLGSSASPWSIWMIVFVNLAIQGAFWLARKCCMRGQATAYSENPDVNRACHYAAVHGWTFYIAVMATLTSVIMSLFPILIEYFPAQAEWISGLFLLFLLISLGNSLFVFRRIRKRQQRILGQEPNRIPVEEDQSYWKAGFYCNPQDSRLMVPKRFGMGWTFNIGNPIGKALMIGSLSLTTLLIAGIIGLFVWMEISPFQISIEGDTVSIHAPIYGTNFSVSEIEAISMTDSIPNGIRTNGAAGGSLRLGHFRLEEDGNALLYIHTDQMPCVRIQLSDCVIYFTGESHQITEEVYQQLSSIIK